MNEAELYKYIKEKAEEAKRDTIKKLKFRLTPKLQISLPNVADVVASGGIVETGEVDAYEGMIVSLNIGDKRVLERKDEGYIELERTGRYRYYVIVDRVGPIEGKG